MRHAVIKLRKLCVVPSVGSTYQISRDALQPVDIAAAAMWAHCHLSLRILISAIHAAVTVMINRAVADIIFVHHVDNPHYHLWVMSGIAINLDIENMSASGQVMIRRLDLGLMPRWTLVVYRHVE